MAKVTAPAVTGLLLSTVAACGVGSAPVAATRSSVASAASPAPTVDTPAASPAPTAASVVPTPSGAASADAPRTGAAASPTGKGGAGAPAGDPGGDSPGRHDGSNYDNLSPEGQEAHDTENCAQIPGKKKGSCNEPHRKCREAGATATSSKGVALTCRTSPKDGRLRWLAAGE
ncbi:hypothetical protein [Streptomyces sp. FH025]|uniref:hypothetical protein n=1 Tax=Streptomyces sp. FH025 TaxID=2815937 RepID=UPI001A9EADD7|nr:hypothetical protein [Streptomyces sp. FH025]MBO1415621.1 hypothetical protein [Streptomyces sp. FH025]